jgi:hypothetical protein
MGDIDFLKVISPAENSNKNSKRLGFERKNQLKTW